LAYFPMAFLGAKLAGARPQPTKISR
jgi:hypothetical protein